MYLVTSWNDIWSLSYMPCILINLNILFYRLFCVLCSLLYVFYKTQKKLRTYNKQILIHTLVTYSYNLQEGTYSTLSWPTYSRTRRSRQDHTPQSQRKSHWVFAGPPTARIFNFRFVTRPQVVCLFWTLLDLDSTQIIAQTTECSPICFRERHYYVSPHTFTQECVHVAFVIYTRMIVSPELTHMRRLPAWVRLETLLEWLCSRRVSFCAYPDSIASTVGPAPVVSVDVSV